MLIGAAPHGRLPVSLETQPNDRSCLKADIR
jgi:hypothetical protein